MFGLGGRWILCGCVALALAACNSDLAQDSSDSPTASTGADSGTSGDQDSGLTGGGGSTGGDSGGTVGPEVGEDFGCEDLDCQPGGSCILDEDGAPACACNDGYASIGYACVLCGPSGAATDLDVPQVVVSGRVTINEVPPPATELEDGNLYLRNPITGDEIHLGNTHDGEVQATVVPGTYDVVYVHESGGSQVPVNKGVRLETRFVDDATPLDIDIPMAPVQGTITIGAETPPDSPVENGRVYLVNPITGDEAPLGQTRAGAYAVNVVPGTYELHYGRIAASTVAPANTDAMLDIVEVPEAGEVLPQVDIDIPAAPVAGAITVGGQVPVDSPVENGRITLRDPRTGSEFQIAETRQGGYDFVVIPGTYEVYYARIAGSTVVPANKRARVVDELVLDGANAPTVDIPTASVSGAFTLGGAPPPASNSDDGVISLRNPETGDVAVLGNTHDGSYSRVVIPGDYQVYYSQETAGAMVPANVSAQLDPINIGSSDTVANIDIPAVDVQGTITVGGTTPPTSEYSDGRLYLRNAATADSVLLGNTRLGSFDARVVPGTYDVVYVVETAGAGVPVNAGATLFTVDVGAAKAFDIDVPVVDLAGAITIGGSAPPGAFEDHGVLLLEDVRTADTMFLGDTRDGAYATAITAGRYVVWYRAVASTGVAPQNANAGVRCVDVLAP